jgi:hypothetical protein
VRRAAGLAALAGALLAFAPAAGAHPIAGIVPDLPNDHAAPPPVARIANLPYGGGPVLHSNITHLIFWEPAASGLTFDPGYEALIETFLKRVAAASHHTDNIYGLTGQYPDTQGPAAYASTYGGETVVTDRLPRSGCVEPPVTGPGWAVCLTDKQLQAELAHVIGSEHLPTGPTDVYFLVTPKGLGSCTDASSTSCALGGSLSGYCAYHSQSSSDVLYAVIPYNAVRGHCQSANPRPDGNTADPALSSVSHEHSEMITDPAGDAWIDSSGEEVGDLCITTFGPALGGSGAGEFNEDIDGGHYYLQEEWSNADSSCQPRAKPDRVRFSHAFASGEASFTAHGTDPHGSIIADMWFFGDGSAGHGARASHRYRRAGRYRVVLRATDSWRNWAFYAETVTVSNLGGRLEAATKSG